LDNPSVPLLRKYGRDMVVVMHQGHILANPNSPVLKDRKALPKQNNSTQNSLCGIASEGHYTKLPIGRI
jgi:hypothetical protein